MIGPSEPDQPSELRDRELAVSDLEDGAALEAVRVSGAELRDVTSRQLRIRESTLQHIDLAGGLLPGLSLSDARLGDCNLANVQARGATVIRTVIRNCRLTGLQLTEARLRDVAFTDCRIDLAGFAADLESVTFQGCLLRETSFQASRLRMVSFTDCDLTGADLGVAKTSGCEMRGFDLTAASGLWRLSGVRMPWSDIVANAAAFATTLGISVLDE